MKIEVNSRELESFVAVAPDEKRGGVVLTCRCAISRTFWQVSLAPEEALVVGLAISQEAVKGLDQRAVCQVYERAMGRVMWAAMDGAEPLNEELGMVNSELLGNVVPFVGAGAGAPASQAGMPTPLACADSLEGLVAEEERNAWASEEPS